MCGEKMKRNNLYEHTHSHYLLHCKMTRAVLTELIVNPVAIGKHALYNAIPCSLRAVCFEVMLLLDWIHPINGLLVTKVDLTMCIQCACLLPVSIKAYSLLPNCPLKAYNVSACYRMLHK